MVDNLKPFHFFLEHIMNDRASFNGNKLSSQQKLNTMTSNLFGQLIRMSDHISSNWLKRATMRKYLPFGPVKTYHALFNTKAERTLVAGQTS